MTLSGDKDAVPRGSSQQVPEELPCPDALPANSVIGKIQLILESFGMDENELSLSDLARRSGISKASVHRLSQELIAWGMLERSGSKYRLGMRAFEIGSRVPRMRVVREAIRPSMEILFHQTGQTIHLAAREGLDVIFLEKIATTERSARPSRIAGRLPMHCSATGKVLLAHAGREVLEGVLERGLTRRTQATIVQPGMLIEQLAKVRREGFAVEREEVTMGYCSVAVPIRSADGTVVAALAVTAPTSNAQIDLFHKHLERVTARVTAAQLIN